MNKARPVTALTAVAAMALVVAGCSGAGYGGGAVATQAPAAAAATPTAAPSAAVPAASTTASGGGDGTGYTRGGYGGGGGTAAAGSVAPGMVALQGYAFTPATLTVATGASLTFTNQDGVAHAIVIGDAGTPAAGQAPVQIAPGQSGKITFPTAGTVKLTCTIHPSMSMTVTVGP